MPKYVPKFSGVTSVASIFVAIIFGIVLGSALTYAVITMLWGRPDLWPLRAG